MGWWTVARWWPPVGLLAMVLLGVAVGGGSTRLDDWFIRTGQAHADIGQLLVFTNRWVVLAMFGLTLAAALYQRRWWLAVVVAVTPVVATAVVRIGKPLFGREKVGALAYPSGHVTLTMVVTGLAVLVAGLTLSTVAAAVAFNVLGLIGQAFTYHYFTDTIGGVFLASSLLCLAAWGTRLDRRQPQCDLSHSSG